MNTWTEQNLLDLAAAALQEQLQQPVQVQEPQVAATSDPHLHLDGRLLIGEPACGFRVEAKRKFTPAMLAQLRTRNQQSTEPPVLVIPYVSDALGQALQRQGVCYLDTAGNAYLRSTDPPFLVLIRGQRQSQVAAHGPQRAFQPAGVQLLYHLLSTPALLQASYRRLAEQAQVALGSVSILLRSLQQLGLLREEEGIRRWTEPTQVLRRWVEAYGEVVRPKLAAQRYRWLDSNVARQGWQVIELGSQAAWGSEPAAHLLLDGYLLPEFFTIYSTLPRSAVMGQLRLVPDPAGNVEVLSPMPTSLNVERVYPQAVPPLLVYADLLLTADPRNREVAHLLHERYLSDLA
ncbi:type IV toxin-antitoxin system AbiEi family antitoxin [Hymenobacter sp. GOD-10R]|uniref:type IV toxin-antitoxin system AbiEi family antitoxin n=1 Tax=Hymenobacter sp. GOD-10R TaxID=3093922 RepID=UPI002D775A7A|nr:type IV toxin-antitoxin system AbiEi family antitoxin [Hymenobacter sp. GOD-10R]WRQ31830.1 type IV toxin-antitoxin system AbiEi family antitoxin [Hymenobacter sp. GOD-10R]